MDESTKPTSVLKMSCSSCLAKFRLRPRSGGSWRQRTRSTRDGRDQVAVFLCPQCAAWFRSEDGLIAYLEAALDQQLEELEGPAPIRKIYA